MMDEEIGLTDEGVNDNDTMYCYTEEFDLVGMMVEIIKGLLIKLGVVGCCCELSIQDTIIKAKEYLRIKNED